MYEEAAKAVTISDNGVHRLANQAQMLIMAQEAVAECEEDLRIAKEMLRKLEQEEIPSTMQELGVENFTLTNGAKISINTFYDAKISDENRGEALRWLHDHGFGSLIKTEVSCKFDRESYDEAIALTHLLKEKGFDYVDKETVHPMTLKTFVKTQIESTEEDVARPPKELFGIYIGKKAKVTLK
jgi:hypothetical protein